MNVMPNIVSFDAGERGAWRIDRVMSVAGEGLSSAPYLDVTEHATSPRASPCAWALRGFTSNARYSRRAEQNVLALRQQGLQRPDASLAALIPIRKSDAWWALAQDERREIFEERSRHIAIGLDALPEVARRLHHSRDLGEPFDFLTWFEFAPQHQAIFDRMLVALRASEEWRYVEREVDIRLSRGTSALPAG